jgi:ketosteroid isomerase-like protein
MSETAAVGKATETLAVGKKLVELCQKGKVMDAVNTLYDKNIVSIEATESPEMPRRMEGIDAIRGKNEWWEKNHEIHSMEVNGPWPHGDRFIARFKLDVTPKAGPMAGKRMTMEEAALYTVKNGKIVQEEFFYDMGG